LWMTRSDVTVRVIILWKTLRELGGKKPRFLVAALLGMTNGVLGLGMRNSFLVLGSLLDCLLGFDGLLAHVIRNLGQFALIWANRGEVLGLPD
jgi:hypothetical protein